MESIASSNAYEERVGDYLKSLGKIANGKAKIEYPLRRAHILSGNSLSGNEEIGAVNIDIPVETTRGGEWIDATVALLAQHHELWGPIYGYPRTYFVSRSGAGLATNMTLGTDFERIIYVLPAGRAGSLTDIVCLDIRHRRSEDEAYSICAYCSTDNSTVTKSNLSRIASLLSAGGISKVSEDSSVREKAFSTNQEGRDLLVRLSMEYSCDAFLGIAQRPKETADLGVSIAVRRIVELEPRQTLSRPKDAVAQSKLFRLPGDQTADRLAAIFVGFVLKRPTTIRGRAEKALSEISSSLDRGKDEEPEELSIVKASNANDVPFDDHEEQRTRRPRQGREETLPWETKLSWQRDDDSL